MAELTLRELQQFAMGMQDINQRLGSRFLPLLVLICSRGA